MLLVLGECPRGSIREVQLVWTLEQTLTCDDQRTSCQGSGKESESALGCTTLNLQKPSSLYTLDLPFRLAFEALYGVWICGTVLQRELDPDNPSGFGLTIKVLPDHNCSTFPDTSIITISA